MSRVVMPPHQHRCTPGWVRRDDYLHDLQLPPGAVFVCDCGKGWVGHRPYVNVMSNSWRRERPIARWLRSRRESAAG